MLLLFCPFTMCESAFGSAVYTLISLRVAGQPIAYRRQVAYILPYPLASCSISLARGLVRVRDLQTGFVHEFFVIIFALASLL